MEPIFHFLTTWLLTGNLICAFGSLLPDIVYYILFFVPQSKYNVIWEFRIYKLGERMHSFFLMFIVWGILGYFHSFLFQVGVGYLLHLFVDFFTSKNNVLYPMKETIFTCQVFDWHENRRMTCIIDSMLIIVTILRGVIIWIKILV